MGSSSLPSDDYNSWCEWVYTLKLKFNRSLDRYEAWVVALGCPQENGINYNGTFSLVAKMTTVQSLLAIDASNIGPPSKWTSRMQSYMVISMKQTTKHLLWVSLCQDPTIFVNYKINFEQDPSLIREVLFHNSSGWF